jgi:heterodisulfide reductase subunit A
LAKIDSGESILADRGGTMSRVLLVGGGLAGCAAAVALSERGIPSVILEKSGEIGGKVRQYGCKASDRCNNCGLCLTGGLWDKVAADPNITVAVNAALVDLYGEKPDFTAVYETGEDRRREALRGITDVAVAIGFEPSASVGALDVQLRGMPGVITGTELERLFKRRGPDRKAGFLDGEVRSIAYLQCCGSRDKKVGAQYCSKVCCAYTTRCAKVLHVIDPAIRQTFFCMDIQRVGDDAYVQTLKDDGAEFIKCRPVAIESIDGRPAVVFEKPGGGLETRAVDLVVLAEGIRPPTDAHRMADLSSLMIGGDGFLQSVREDGVTVLGCAGGPGKIEEVYAASVAYARNLR